MAPHRRHWLWVARPDATNLGALDAHPAIADGWWTTHGGTHRGDLALVYLSSPVRAISYMCEATSNAFEANWDGPAWVCGFETRVKFGSPLDLAAMKSDPISRGFKPLASNLRQRVYEVPMPIWQSLVGLLVERNLGAAGTIRQLGRRRVSHGVLREEQIEAALAAHLDVLRPTWKLRLDQRQFVCDGLGRVDLLCRDQKGWVVIELKRDRATRDVVGQVTAYMGWVRSHRAAKDEDVRGLVIAPGADHRFTLAADVIPDVSFLDLRDIAPQLGIVVE